MAVHGCIAVSRKMLRRGQDQILLVGMRAFDEGLHVGGDILRILAEGADIDDGVVGIIVDVGDRIIDPLDAERASFARGRPLLRSA